MTLKLRAICPRCARECNVLPARNERDIHNDPSRLVLGQHNRDQFYGGTRCNSSGADASTGLAGWIERERKRAQAVLDSAAERVKRANADHCAAIDRIKAENADAEVRLVRLRETVETMKGGEK